MSCLAQILRGNLTISFNYTLNPEAPAEALEWQIREAISRATRITVEQIRTYAHRNLPEVKGGLIESIGIQTSPDGLTLTIGAHYAKFVESGTTAHKPPHPTELAKAAAKYGMDKWKLWGIIKHYGTKPHPFWSNLKEFATNTFKREFRAALQEVLQEG